MADEDVKIVIKQKGTIPVYTKTKVGVAEVHHDKTLKGSGTISVPLGISDEVMEEIENAGKVDDVRVDGVSVVTDKIAEIDLTGKVDKTSEADKVYGTDAQGNQTTYDVDGFGKVDDVLVNGTSVVTNKIAEVEVPTAVSELTNDADYQSGTQVSNTVSSAINTHNTSNDAHSNLLTPITEDISDIQDQIDNLSGRGRFLALWNCATGLAESNPPESPYPYKAGDYFVVGTVSSADPAVNYKPDGSSYTTGVASTTVETNEVSVNDTYFYDGSVWKLQSNAQKEVSFSALAGSPYDNTNLSNALNAKQNTLTAGVNISIVNDVISSTAQESFFRGNFNEWSDVPTDTSLYQEDIHGNRVPKDTDFIIVEDASQFIPSGSLMHKLVVENLQTTEAFTIRITDENGVSQKCYWENYNRAFVAIDDYYSLKYQPGAPGIWYIKTNDGSPIIIKGTTYSSGEAQLCLTTDPATPFDAGMPPSAGEYTGAWRFAYYGVWSTDGITGWTPQYKIENTLPIADATTLGIAKLYTTTGNNTDGSMTQKSITDALGAKQDTLVSGTNIKTVNNNSLLGAGNISTLTTISYNSETEELTIS